MALAVENAWFKVDEYGQALDRGRWGAMSPIHIAPTEAQARAEVRFGLRQYTEYVRQILPMNVPVDSDVDPERASFEPARVPTAPPSTFRPQPPMRSRPAAVGLLLAAFAVASRPAAAQGAGACDAIAGNLVANCGFEAGAFGGWAVGGDVSNSGVDQLSAHSGTYGAFFANGDPLTLSQTLATTSGTRYTYRFWLRSEDAYPGAAFFRAFADGRPVFDLAGQAPLGYTEYSFTDVAVGTSTRLEFVVENAPSFYQLDDVSAAPAASTVPEPGGVALVGSGLLTLLAVAARRRTSQAE